MVAPQAGSRRHRMWKIELDLLLCVKVSFVPESVFVWEGRKPGGSRDLLNPAKAFIRAVVFTPPQSNQGEHPVVLAVIGKERREQHIGNDLGNDSRLSLCLSTELLCLLHVGEK